MTATQKLIDFSNTLTPTQGRALLLLASEYIDEVFALDADKRKQVQEYIDEHAGIPREPQIKGSYEVVAIAGTCEQLGKTA